MTKITKLQRELAACLKQYVDAEGDRTGLLRHAAALTIELRECFEYDGRPDWTGVSYAYRQAMSAALGDLDPSDRRRIRDALAWHVSEALHARLSPADVEALGLRPLRPKERNAERHERNRAILASAYVEGRDSALMAVMVSARALAQVKAASVDALSREDLAEMAKRLEDLHRQAERVERLVERRLSR